MQNIEGRKGKIQPGFWVLLALVVGGLGYVGWSYLGVGASLEALLRGGTRW
jgi:hypothetical protein